MANIEDYSPGGKFYKGPEVDAEIDAASQQQEERIDSTPDEDIDWEKRYADLNVAYSRQGQQMGDYRKLIDDYVTTTPDNSQDSVETSPITPDDIYENPDEAVRRAVDSHPAIKRVEQLEVELEQQRALSMRDDFTTRHPDFEKTVKTPEFANWVAENQMRSELAQRGDRYDMTAADALLTLWAAENAASQVQRDTDIDALNLETGTGVESPAPERYSRSEMLQQKIRAKQGDLTAEAYVKTHAVNYRLALGEGNVRD